MGKKGGRRNSSTGNPRKLTVSTIVDTFRLVRLVIITLLVLVMPRLFLLPAEVVVIVIEVAAVGLQPAAAVAVLVAAVAVMAAAIAIAITVVAFVVIMAPPAIPVVVAIPVAFGAKRKFAGIRRS